jgi:hypothetical protein
MNTGLTIMTPGNHPLPAANPNPGALVVLAATVAMAMGFGGLGLITVFMGPIETDLGWSRSDTSLGYALSTAGMAIGGVGLGGALPPHPVALSV